MANERCPYAYRKVGDVSLHCKRQTGGRMDYCAHQYFCGVSKRWEATAETQKCPLRNEKNQE